MDSKIAGTIGIRKAEFVAPTVVQSLHLIWGPMEALGSGC